MIETSFKTAVDQVKAVADGQSSVHALACALFERIDAVDASVAAWAFIDRERVLATAKELDRGPGRPLRGLIFAAKDNIDTHDMPTAYGSQIYAGKTPARDAACIASLRMQGALLLGKTVSTEFAHVFPGPTRNPHNDAHTPGGSSSGSAAAVAAQMVPAALGTQTTGSVIRPAAFCGTVGFKPTYGDINTSGVLANAASFDTVGLITRSVADAALLHSSLVQASDNAVKPRSVSGMRVGLCRTPWWERADDEARNGLEQTAQTLERQGATVNDFDDGGAFDDLESISQRVSGFEFAQTLSHERLHAMDQLSAALREGRMRTGTLTSHAQYVADKQRLEQARLIMDGAFEQYDVVICLPAAGPAPMGLQRTGDAIFNMPWTSLHTPAITLPMFSASNGLPMGLQVCAKRHRDHHLLECAAGIWQVAA